MENIDRKAAELMAEFRKIGDRYMQWQDNLAHEKMSALSKHDGSVIFFLGQDGECTMSELALKIRLTVSSATLIVDRLVERGLVSRHRSLEDRRVVRVALTDEGAGLHRVVADTILGLGRAMLMALDEREQDQLLSLYRKITAALPRT
jgi:DNA-binding MarR family transcriptional regulator